MYFYFKLECIEIFLNRAFYVQDEYTKALEPFEDASSDDANKEGVNLNEDYFPEEENWSDDYFDEYDEQFAEYEHVSDILMGYQEIVFRAVYWELNALIESELKNLARTILNEGIFTKAKLTRGNSRKIIERNIKSISITYRDLKK